MERLRLNINSTIKQGQIDEGRASDYKLALTLIDEVLDMLDPTTTIDGNDNIFVAQTPGEAARIIDSIISR